MNIGELKNKDLQKYRKQGKIEALKAARQKADYLVAAMEFQLFPTTVGYEQRGNTKL